MHLKPFVLGICGGSGSGKTYTVTKITERFPCGTVSILDQDSYYKDLSHLSPLDRSSVNFDHPSAIDFDQLAADLESLIGGNVIEKPVYDFSTHARSKANNKIAPSPIIIVEGHHIFCQEQIIDNIDHKVYLDIAMDIRFIRRLVRDISERGRDIESVIEQYLNTVRPMDIEFIQPAKTHADCVITSNNYEHKLSEIIQLLLAYLDTTKSSHE